VTFRNQLVFYGEVLLALRQTYTLENHPLSSLRDYLFILFAACLSIRWPSDPHAT